MPAKVPTYHLFQPFFTNTIRLIMIRPINANEHPLKVRKLEPLSIIRTTGSGVSLGLSLFEDKTGNVIKIVFDLA